MGSESEVSAMGVSGVAGGGQSQPSQSSTSAATALGGNGQLGQDTFLKLLVAQLQYQDPLQPMDSTQFVTQLAQFQSLSELQAIQADLDKLVAAQQTHSAGGQQTTGTAGNRPGDAG